MRAQTRNSAQVDRLARLARVHYRGRLARDRAAEACRQMAEAVGVI